MDAYKAAQEGALLADVREKAETSDVWLDMENVIFIPFSLFAQLKKELPFDKQLILCCAVGIVSEKAARLLSEAGYEHVFVLRNGLIAWQSAGLPLKTAAGLFCKCQCCNKNENENDF
jgi:rhodanese-related sulfurtransferase